MPNLASSKAFVAINATGVEMAWQQQASRFVATTMNDSLFESNTIAIGWEDIEQSVAYQRFLGWLF